MSTLLWTIIIVAAIILLWIISAFNTLVRLKNRTKEAWSDIDVQLKRRYDLIPNLVETVKGYAAHEKETLDRVVQARAQAMQAGGAAEKAKAENMLSDTLKSIFALAENYPNLKANENFLELQRELSDTENKIQAARRFYNGNVRDFNTKQETFPTNLMVPIMGFKKSEFFELEEATVKEPVKVQF